MDFVSVSAIADGRQTRAVTVPDPLVSLSARARRTGGNCRTHPLWSVTTSAAPAISKSGQWQLASIKSNPNSAQVNFHRLRPTFSFLSLKSGRTQTGESHYELANAKEKEVDPNIVDLQLQGISMRFEGDGQEKTYTPDAVALDAAGTIIVEEVKASPSYFAEPEYRSLMTAAEISLQRMGISFRKVTGEQMERARRRRYNVDRAFADRFTAFGQQQVEAVEGLFAANSEQPLGRVEEVLKAHPMVSRMIVNAMMCARHLAYDLNLRLDANTIVSPAPRVPGALPDIRALTA